MTSDGRTAYGIACATRGLRLSAKQRCVTDALERADAALPAEEIFGLARRADSKISRATVYNTLRALWEKGLVCRCWSNDGRSLYGLAPSDIRLRLTDVGSGRSILVRDAEFEAVLERVVTQLGYQLSGSRMELFGIPL